MSIIDGMMTPQGDLSGAIAVSESILEKFFANAQFSKKQQEIIDLVREGISFGDIMGITKEHRDALFAHSIQLIRAGERAKARDILLQVYLFEPLDEARSIYALANTYQLDGKFEPAAQLYLHFLALDATNPDGHLRLGECFLAAQEYDNARTCFETAARLAERGHGNPGAGAHAAKMLAVLEERRANPSN